MKFTVLGIYCLASVVAQNMGLYTIRSNMKPPNKTLSAPSMHPRRFNIKQGSSFSIECTVSFNSPGPETTSNSMLDIIDFYYEDEALDTVREPGEINKSNVARCHYHDNIGNVVGLYKLVHSGDPNLPNVTVTKLPKDTPKTPDTQEITVKLNVTFHNFQPIHNHVYKCLPNVCEYTDGSKSRKLYNTGPFSFEPVTTMYQIYNQNELMQMEVKMRGEFYLNGWIYSEHSSSPPLVNSSDLFSQPGTAGAHFRQRITIDKNSTAHRRGYYIPYVRLQESDNLTSEYSILFRDPATPEVMLHPLRTVLGHNLTVACTATGYPLPDINISIFGENPSVDESEGETVTLHNATPSLPFTVAKYTTLTNVSVSQNETMVVCTAAVHFEDKSHTVNATEKVYVFFEPTPPRNLTGGNTGTMSAILQWLEPVNPNGILQHYVVYYSVGETFQMSSAASQSFPPSSTTHQISSLSSNTLYTFVVSANNSLVMSDFSNKVTIFIPSIGGADVLPDIIPPSNPTNVLAIPMASSVHLTWEEPVFTANLTNYIARCISTNGNSDISRNTSGVGTNITLEGLIPETAYSCHVISVAFGIQGGSNSAQTTTTTPMLMMPMNVNATATSPTTIQVQWEHPPFMETIDHYFISWNPIRLPDGVILEGGMEEINCVSPNTPVLGSVNCTDVTEFNITGLEEYVEYRVTVTASNDVGNSTSGMDVERTLPDVPTAPVRPTVTDVLPTSFLVLWSPPTEPNGVIVSYQVTYTGIETLNEVDSTFFESSVVTLDGPFEQTEITGLVPFSNYSVSVAAFTSAGSGPPSENVTVGTAPSVPSAPRNLTAVNITTNSFVVEWKAPADPNGPVSTYNVEILVGESVLKAENTSLRMLAVTGLDPVVKHTINICAYTIACGNVSTLAVQTSGVPPVLTSFSRSNRDVVLGEDLVVSCSAEGRPVPAIVWQMNSTVLTSGGDVLISNTSNERSELRIRNFTRSNSGQYSCTATNTFGNISASFRVNLIIVRPNITGVNAAFGSVVTPLAHNGQLTLEEFASLSLSCTASGEPPPEIVWLLDGTVLSTNRRRSIMSTLSYSNLTIGELQLSDAGTYTCRATSGNVFPIPGQTTVDIQLTVTARNECLSNPCQNGGQCTDGIDNFFCSCISTALVVYSGRNCSEITDQFFPPSITTQPVGRTDYKLFETVTLNCTAEGNPDPVITWYKDGVALQGPQSVGKVYTIDSISPGDRGTYHCEATNSRGRATSNSARVLIEGIVQLRIELVKQEGMERRNSAQESIQFKLQSLAVGAVGQQLRGTGNVTAEIVSLVQVPNSTEFIVTVNTNSTQSPQQLTQIITQPLTEQFEEYLDILQTASFTVEKPERYDGCPEEVSSDCSDIDMIKWPEKEIGEVATVRCPCGPEGENPLPSQPVTTRQCEGNYDNGARWGPQMCTECQFSGIRTSLCQLLNETSIPHLVSKLANVTKDGDRIQSEDITIVSVLLDRISHSEFADNSEVSNDFFLTIDNLFEISEAELKSSNEQNGSVNRITGALDQVIDKISLTFNTSASQRVVMSYHNFAIALLMPPQNNDSFSPNISALVEAANITKESTENDITTAKVIFPPGLTLRGGILALAVFLRNSLYPTDDTTSVESIILFASFPNYKVENLTKPITFVFEKSKQVKMTSDPKLSCAFWDSEINGHEGDWSSEGCRLANDTGDSIVCECNHLTSFSMLLDISPKKRDGSVGVPKHILTSFSYIGAAVSILALIVTIVTYLSEKRLRRNLHRQLLISLCFALLGLYITFIITNAVSSYPDILPSIRPICGLLSALLHYFFLVTFLAMAAIAINLYRKLVVVFNSKISSYLSTAALICWVVPVFIVGFSIAPHYQYYTGEVIPGETVAYCRAQSWPFYFGLILPFGVIYIFNLVMFVVIFASILCRPNLESTSRKGSQVKENLGIITGLAFLFGFTWVFGLLTSGSLPEYVKMPFDVTFTVLASLQGVFVFILYCLRSADCRRVWKKWILCRCFKNEQFSNAITIPKGSPSSDPKQYLRVGNAPAKSCSTFVSRGPEQSFSESYFPATASETRPEGNCTKEYQTAHPEPIELQCLVKPPTVIITDSNGGTEASKPQDNHSNGNL